MDLWNQFIQTGSVKDYLNYKKEEQELINANDSKGFNNQGADDRRE